MRHQYTCDDATHLALAEALSAPLFTCDSKLAGTAHSADVQVLPRTH